MSETVKPLVALDVDGVLAAFIPRLFNIYNEKHGTSYSDEDVTCFEFYDCFPKHVAKELYELFNVPGFFADLDVIDGAKDMVEGLLTLGCEIELCTTPSSHPHPVTKQKVINADSVKDKVIWINKHFPKLGNNITLTRRKQMIQANYLIDDGYHNVEAWGESHADSGGIGLLIDQPWNRDSVLTDLSHSARLSLSEVPTFIEQRLNMSVRSTQ